MEVFSAALDYKTRLKMNKIKNLSELRKMRQVLQDDLKLRENCENPESIVQVKVGMGTSGIASGAKEVMEYLITELQKRSIEAVVTQVGDMGYSFAEPTVEITKPGEEAVVFGDVNEEKVNEMIDKYIQHGELIEGILPQNYDTIN